jgi:hypothetical protein
MNSTFVSRDRPPQELADLQYKTQILDWVKNFLAKPHPDLGRSGIVCPFVPRTLQLNTVQTIVIHTQGLEEQQIEDVVKDYRNHFLVMEPQRGELAIYKAIMLIFPDISEPEDTALIDRIQQRLKIYFVEEGLMIGEFHQYNDSPGLHNPNFKPLRSPIPMLAIRFMTESDLPFLSRLSDQPQVRIQYLNAYLRQMVAIVTDVQALAKAKAALELAQMQLETEPLSSVQPIDHETLETSSKTSRCPLLTIAQWLKQVFAR